MFRLNETDTVCCRDTCSIFCKDGVSRWKGAQKNMNKSYETVWEIFNECANNQMRDVFFDEIETDDTDAYVKGKFKDKQITFEKSVLSSGTDFSNVICLSLNLPFT